MTVDELIELSHEVIKGAVPQVSQSHDLGWFDWEDCDDTTHEGRIVLMVHCHNKGWAVRLKPTGGAGMTPLAQLLALIIWSEARGEGPAGMEAVASVIHYRAGGDPAKMEAVVTKRRQFSCYPACMSDRPWEATGADAEAWQRAQRIANLMECCMFIPTINATHYRAYYVHPRWERKMVRVGSVGRHVFYLEKKHVDSKTLF